MNPEHIKPIIQRIMEGMMEHKLCQKCRETIGLSGDVWWHCHHAEPAEKQKENIVDWAKNHYWDSLQKDKDLIVKHIKEGFFVWRNNYGKN